MKRISIVVVVLALCCSFGVAGAAPAGESGLRTGSVGAAQAGAPVYPGGKPINGGLIDLTLYSKKIGTHVTFSTNDSFEDVYKYYKHALPSNAVSSETDDDPASKIGTFKYTKGDGSQIDIEIQAFPGRPGLPKHVNYSITDTYKK
jgi:hypothetical protein